MLKKKFFYFDKKSFCEKLGVLIKFFDVKFMFSKKATKTDEIFTVDLTFTTYSYNSIIRPGRSTA